MLSDADPWRSLTMDPQPMAREGHAVLNGFCQHHVAPAYKDEIVPGSTQPDRAAIRTSFKLSLLGERCSGALHGASRGSIGLCSKSKVDASVNIEDISVRNHGHPALDPGARAAGGSSCLTVAMEIAIRSRARGLSRWEPVLPGGR